MHIQLWHCTRRAVGNPIHLIAGIVLILILLCIDGDLKANLGLK